MRGNLEAGVAADVRSARRAARDSIVGSVAKRRKKHGYELQDDGGGRDTNTEESGVGTTMTPEMRDASSEKRNIVTSRPVQLAPKCAKPLPHSDLVT